MLLRVRDGELIKVKEAKESEKISSVFEPDNFEYLPEELSDHIKMQWKLINLGVKAGSKVWIPKNDQSKINRK